MLRKLLPILVLAVACRRAPETPPVVLISIDTLRSDHLPLYGYRAIATPHLDALAKDGVVFEHAFSHVPLTLPSHTSILTGLLPTEHGVRDNAGFRLDPATPTIASMLRARGYATGAAVSAYVLRATTNLNTGFDQYDDNIPFIEGAPTGNLQRAGSSTVAVAKQWIAAHAAQPFFAFVHLFEPHAPYEPTYDGEIVKADALVGEIVATLREQKLYDDALVIVLSDHGEGLRDHGEQEHGVLLYRETLQVPLIVKMPRNERAGTRVAAVAELIDILPTIAAATHSPVPPRAHGQALFDPLPSRPIYAETLYPRIHLGWSELHSLIAWPHHLIEGPKPELYDAAHDPRELHDLRDQDRRTYARLHADLAAVPQPELTAPRVDPEESRKLAALGYVSAQPGAAKSELNPRDHLGDLDALKHVTELMSARQYAEAAKTIEDLLTRNPGWSDLRDTLGVAYEAMGDLPRAEKTYRDAIRATPELAPDFALSLAGVLLEERKYDEAAAHAKIALQSNPSGAHELLANIAMLRGDLDTALREVQQAPQADFLRAQILAALGDLPAALQTLQRMHERHAPLPRRYFYVTADILARLGRLPQAQEAFERAVQTEPHDTEAWAHLAFLQQMQGDATGARATLDAMVAANPGTEPLRAKLLRDFRVTNPTQSAAGH
ncbi:MAG TPA: sulfatase-like hydrolase/transferase [Thermoanaerobaculia bacterium]|nr:sulfatase-like hydrolase/transferase [Thermoanaerobaculia bacterium]